MEIDHTAPRDAGHTRLKLARAKVKGYSEKRNEFRKLAAAVVVVASSWLGVPLILIVFGSRKGEGEGEFCDKF